jgi:hypothetical protein
MKTTKLPVHTCTACGAANDAASHEQATPSSGDVSLCWYCGELTLFNEDLTQRAPTEEELAAIKENPAWHLVQNAIDQIHKRKRNEN